MRRVVAVVRGAYRALVQGNKAPLPSHDPLLPECLLNCKTMWLRTLSVSAVFSVQEPSFLTYGLLTLFLREFLSFQMTL